MAHFGNVQSPPVEDLGEMSSRRDNRTIEQTEGK